MVANIGFDTEENGPSKLRFDHSRYPKPDFIASDLSTKVAELEAEAEELRRRVAEQAAKPNGEVDPQAAALASLESKLGTLQAGNYSLKQTPGLVACHRE